MTKWQASILVFLIALVLRLFTLNQMGRTWDEPSYVQTGYRFVQLFQKGNFTDPFWYLQSDHPPLIRYAYGLAGAFDIKSIGERGVIEYNYDYTHARLVSVILGALSAVFIVLIGYEYFSPFVGFSSGLIFSLIPFFLGLSQIATLESFIMFFFTGTVFYYLKLLNDAKFRWIFLTGIFCGLAMLVKQSNILLYPLLLTVLVIHFLFLSKKTKKYLKNQFLNFLLIGLFSLGIFFLLWPMPFFHLSQLWGVQQKMWIDAVHLPPPERFFGKLILVPFPYYFVMFLITTPIVLVVLSLIALLRIDKKRNFIGIALLVWFLFPFLQSFYPFKQHGVRYIIELYAPFALLCGVGLEYLGRWIGYFKSWRIMALSFVVLYLCIILLKVHPYYLDYFSEPVGGNHYVYSKQLFQMGWWGQGIGEATYYISQHEKRSVTVAIDGEQAASVMPGLKNIKKAYYDKNKTFDYVLVPYFNVVRLRFPEEELSGKYKLVHSVLVDKAKLVKIYKFR